MARRSALARCAAIGFAVASVGCSGEAPEPVGTTSEPVMMCPTTVVEGVDVYDGNGTIDWTKVAGDGRHFAFMKATQGDYNTQTTFPANWSGAKAAGVLRSPYHFFDPTIDGVAQANHFLTVLKAAGGLQPGDLPPMLDIECPTASTQAASNQNCEYMGNSGWVASATLSQRVFDWLTTVETATGRKAVIYSYPSWFADVGFTDAKLAGYPLFIATLSTCASVPAPWTSADFWQYSWTGTVTGITGQVDVDRFFGSLGQLGGFGMPDAGAPHDAGGDAHATHDAAGDGPSDETSGPDSGVDASTSLDGSGEPEGSIETASKSGSNGGCGCHVAGARASAPVSSGAFAALGALGVVLVRVRRSRSRCASRAAPAA